MHIPVLVREVVERLAVCPGETVLDGTLGAGGHARALLESVPGIRIVGIDRDAGALERARANLGALAAHVTFLHGRFADMKLLAEQAGVSRVDRVLCDLGFSSDQMDNPDRGFSFMADGPLDMRLDLSQPQTAADLVNDTPEQDLADLIYKLGDESASRRIARMITETRRHTPFRSTLQLADVVSRAKGGRRGSRIHPATQTFQAIRMAVNDELGQAEAGCESALRLVRPGGRVAFITFHGGEDAVIKRCFARHVGRDVSLQQGGSRWEGAEPRASWVAKKPVTATDDEVRANPRARSAKLRVVERCG